MGIDCGVPQGSMISSILGPLLFLIYMNDLPSCLKFSKAILFADDTTLYYSSSDIDLLYSKVNTDLNGLVEWFRANYLSLNTSKTHYLFLTPNKTDPLQNINGDIIQRTKSCKFLGITIDDQLKWGDHIANVHSKLSKSLYILNRCKHYVPLLHMRTLYNSIFHSHLSYGIVLWGSTYKTYLSRLRVVQKKAIRCINNVNYNAHTSPLFKENNILPLDGTYQQEIGKYMHNALRNKLPHPLNEFHRANSSVHDYGTRQRNHPHISHRRSAIASQQIMFNGPTVWSKIPSEITRRLLCAFI